jgi:hypothetical protein
MLQISLLAVTINLPVLPVTRNNTKTINRFKRGQPTQLLHLAGASSSSCAFCEQAAASSLLVTCSAVQEMVPSAPSGCSHWNWNSVGNRRTQMFNHLPRQLPVNT